MLRRLVACLLFVLPASFAAAQNQAIVLKPEFKVGTDLVYVMAQRTNVDQVATEQLFPGWHSVCTATLVLHIDEVNSDGSLIATGTFRRGDIVFVEDKKVPKVLGYTWGPETRMDSDARVIPGMGEALQQAKLTIQVDAAGNPSIAGFDTVTKRFVEANQGDHRALGFFSPDKLSEMIAPIFKADSPGPTPIRTGHRWSTVEHTPLQGQGELSLTVDFELGVINAESAEYAGLPTYTLTPLPSAAKDGTEVRVSSSAGGVGTTFDLKLRQVSMRKQSLQLDTVFIKDGVNIMQKQQVINYLKLGDGKK